MQGQINPKIVGATVIGFALIGGAYTISHFGEPRYEFQTASVQSTISTQRVAIEVYDKDSNGIEDWRDDFITNETVILKQDAEDYTPPDTLTGKMSIDFLQNVIRSRGYGPFGSSDDEIIDRTIDQMSRETEIEIYDTPDITIMEKWNDQDIVNYANTLANVLYTNSIPDLDFELDIIHDIVTYNKMDRMDDLITLLGVYQGYLDDTLKIPVPAIFAKQHLDLINTYNAIRKDIESMTMYREDPAAALLRLKRYEDDAAGLAYALQNTYLVLEPYAALFDPEDPAVLFVVFSPGYQY